VRYENKPTARNACRSRSKVGRNTLAICRRAAALETERSILTGALQAGADHAQDRGRGDGQGVLSARNEPSTDFCDSPKKGLVDFRRLQN